MAKKTRRRKGGRTRRRHRRQRGGETHDCSFDPYTRTTRFSEDGLIWNVKDHPEWVLKEIHNTTAEAAKAWSKPVAIELEKTKQASDAGIAPRVIATNDCGVRTVVSDTGTNYGPHWVGWIVMEKVNVQPPPPGETGLDRLRTALREAGLSGRWDDTPGNALYGTTASHPEPKWWAIDFGMM